MVLTLSSNLRAASQKMQTDKDWLWLLQLEADVSATNRTLFRLTDCPQTTTLDLGGGTTWTFYPFPLSFAAIEQDTRGNVQTMTVTLSNITRELIPYLFAGDGFMRRRAWIYQLSRSSLLIEDALTHEYLIGAAAADANAVTLTMRSPVTYDRELPQEQLGRFCSNVYMDDVCGYRGPLSSCKFTLADCIAHGVEEETRGYPNRHPWLFNGFVALSRKAA